MIDGCLLFNKNFDNSISSTHQQKDNIGKLKGKIIEEFYYNLRKDGHSRLRLFHIYSMENGPRATGFCIGVGGNVRQELKKFVFS